MRSARISVMAGTALLAATAANAADMPAPQPQLPIGAWYLRGDVGITNQQLGKIENKLLPPFAQIVNSEFDSSTLFGLGVGYQFNYWLRLDVTGEYRGKSGFSGRDIIDFGPGGIVRNEHRAEKSEWLFLANAYIDLGTWWCVTPFVGAGIGVSEVTISDFTDICTTCGAGSVAFGDTASQWNFAWALHAGLAYQASSNLAIELAYRYTHLGDGIAGDVITSTGVNNVFNPTTFRDITSHDIKLGLRWTL